MEKQNTKQTGEKRRRVVPKPVLVRGPEEDGYFSRGARSLITDKYVAHRMAITTPPGENLLTCCEVREIYDEETGKYICGAGCDAEDDLARANNPWMFQDAVPDETVVPIDTLTRRLYQGNLTPMGKNRNPNRW